MYDFEPYFCTVAECEAPFDVPNSFEGLLTHMQSHVPVVVFATTLNGNFDGSTFEASTGQTMDATDTQQHAMAKRGPFLFEDCPFCGGYPELLEKRYSDRGTLDAQLALRKHIKNHMQEIALYLPPYRSDAPSISDESIITAITHHRSSIPGIGDVPMEFDDICDQEECDCKIFEDKEEYLVPLIDATEETESRWQCCRCGEDYALDLKDVCTHGHEHRLRDCLSCHKYERDCGVEGDWGHLLQGLSLAEIYAHPVTRRDYPLPSSGDQEDMTRTLHVSTSVPATPLVQDDEPMRSAVERASLAREATDMTFNRPAILSIAMSSSQTWTWSAEHKRYYRYEDRNGKALALMWCSLR
jgi:hypothetical protein